MQKFKDFIKQPERKDPSTTLHAFDIDETLFSHDHDHLKIHVKHKKSGKVVKSLTNQEYNSHKLHPDHEYDYSEFRSSKTFEKSARPIRSMIAKLKAIHKRNKNVEMLTARADFDDKDHFGKHMKKFGLDIDKIHVRRAGNLGDTAPKNKAKAVSALIQKHGYKKVHLYDDSLDNLKHFKALKKKHPDVEFHAHHVDHNHVSGETKITKL
jgi:hypothetical protein